MTKFCTGCGAQLSDEAKFCPSCGAQQVQAQQPYAPQHQQAYAPAPAAPKKKSKAPLIIGGAIALVILITVVAFSGREDSGLDPGGNDSPTHSAPGPTFGNSMNSLGNTTSTSRPPEASMPTYTPNTTQASGTFELKIFQGYDFQNKSVIDYGNNPDSVDIKFYAQNLGDISRRRVYLEALKIQYFEDSPTNLTSAQADEWNYYVLGPAKLYYVIRSRDGRYYLLHLKEQENYEKTAEQFWVFTFDWQEISVN